MKEIKFKNDYEKLPKEWDETQAKLMCCYPEKLSTIINGLNAFLKNDTKIRCDKPNESYYPVNYPDLLILIFIHYNTGKIFSTLRHNTEKNFELYINSIGETFNLVRS